MNDVFAIHVTWTTYGTWLPGDSRGYVSVTLRPEGGVVPIQNQYGTPYSKNDAYARRVAIDEQAFPTVWLTAEQTLVVALGLVMCCAKRGWWVAQAAIMCNHVHVVVMGCPHDGPAVRRILKGVTQAALNDHAGQARRWYTHRGSNRYKFDQRAIDHAINYVKQQKDMLAGVDDMRVFVVDKHGEIHWVEGPQAYPPL
jgi:REP element-mobilizing transposase RayT